MPCWNMQYLKQLETEIPLHLLSTQEFDEDTIQVYSRIKGICSFTGCKNEFNKAFRDLNRTRNPACNEHAKVFKSNQSYQVKLNTIKSAFPSIQLTWPDGILTTQQQCKISFKCIKPSCQTHTERNLSSIIQRDDIMNEDGYLCMDCCHLVASSNRTDRKGTLLKDSEFFNQLFEIPKCIDSLTIGSNWIAKFKCESCCPNCMKKHEYYETPIFSKCIDNSGCGKCLHLNDCDCVNSELKFICLTCRNYLDTDLKDKNCNTCKMCRSKYNNGNVRLTISTLVSQTYKRTGQDGRKQKNSELTNDFVMQLYETQNKRCYYSNIPLGFTKFDDWKITIERLDIDKGYLKDNVVLTCIEFQSGFRPWNKEKWNSFCINFDRYQLPLTTAEITELNRLEEHDHVKQVKRVIYVDAEKNEKLCHRCGKIKNLTDDFTQSGLKNHSCKDCVSIYQKRMKHTLSGRLRTLWYSSWHNTKSRQSKSTVSKRGDLTHTLTRDELLCMWKYQQGRCYYSNYPMNMTGDYQVSLERINNKLGYTKENCVLICLEFNVGGHEIYNLEEATNSYSWNKEKVIQAVNTSLKKFI